MVAGKIQELFLPTDIEQMANPQPADIKSPGSTSAEGYVIRSVINQALFEIRSPIGRYTNMAIMATIIFSVLASMMGTVDGISGDARHAIQVIEYSATALFAIEYFARLFTARMPARYALSFYGLVDLATILPILFAGNAYLAIRLLRIFRLIKLLRYLRAFRAILASMRDVYETILIVIATILVILLVSGNLIYILEPEVISNAFDGCWWSLVTMTTVGYGDIVPQTIAGKLVAAVLMLTGISMFAMLTATISVKISQSIEHSYLCTDCGSKISGSYLYCPHCGISKKKSDHASAQRQENI